MGIPNFNVTEELARVMREVREDDPSDVLSYHEQAEVLIDRLEARGLKIVEAPR